MQSHGLTAKGCGDTMAPDMLELLTKDLWPSLDTACGYRAIFGKADHGRSSLIVLELLPLWSVN